MNATARWLLAALGPLALVGCPAEDPSGDDDSPADDDAADDDAADDDATQGEITLSHTPPSGAVEGQDVDLSATAHDEAGVLEVIVRYRNVGEDDFRQAGLAVAQGDDWGGAIPGADVSSHGLEYYLQATGGSGTAVAPEGAPASTYHLDTDNVAPSIPTRLRAPYDWQAEAVVVGWDPPTSLDVATIEVFRSADDAVDASDTLVGTDDGTAHAVSDPDDEDGTLSTTYSWYGIRVTDDHGLEAWSDPVSTSNLHLYLGFVGNSSPNAQASDGKFNLPTGMAVDAGGQAYVADSNNHRVQVFGPDGTYLRKFGAQGTGDGQFQLPWDVAVDTAGNVWVAEYQNHRVQVVDAAGAHVVHVGTGSYTSDEGGFWFPMSIDRDAAGYFYVVDDRNPRVQKFAPDGTFVAAWTTAGGVPFADPGGVAWHAWSGGLLVTDQGLDRVFLLDTDGGLIADFGEPGTGDGQLSEPHGPCATPAGYAVVTDGDVALSVPDSHRVTLFDETGAFSWSFGEFGSAEGELSVPSDCATGPDGELWVVNRIDYRVHRYGP